MRSHVCVEVMGTRGPPQTPDGAGEIRVYRNEGVCGSTDEKSHCVF